jgi:hypothetical protein
VQRDSYRGRVITAEADVICDRTTLPDLRSLQQRVLKSKWWERRKDEAIVSAQTYDDGRELPCENYHDLSSMLYTPVGSPQVKLMHALAHEITVYTDEMSAHGPEFCKTFLEITRRFLGQHVRDSLAVAFVEHKVKTRTWSPEAKEAARKRTALRELKAMREELHGA